MSIILKAVDLKQRFGNNKILINVNLEIEHGEIFGVIGSSGSGKTTLLKTLIGFLTPNSGKVYFNKGKTNDNFISVISNPVLIKKKIGFAVQQPSFYSKLTVTENLDYFGALFNLSKEARLTNIKTILELVELSHAKDLIAKNLSGGMQRRLDIACSLIHNPDILILDEPTSDLDLVLAKNMWELIKKINKKGTTIVVASHDLNEIEHFCSRISILHKGKLTTIGSNSNLKNFMSKEQEIHIETYPGDYSKIKTSLKDSNIIKIENKGSSLVIHTNKPDKILKKLLPLLEKLDENLLDVNISKLNLKDVFKDITKK